jgi:hypothetical protein
MEAAKKAVATANEAKTIADGANQRPPRRPHLLPLTQPLSTAGTGIHATTAAGEHDKTGVLALNDGHDYRGELLEGRAHGRGVAKWPSGHEYRGSWWADQRTGWVCSSGVGALYITSPPLPTTTTAAAAADIAVPGSG